MRSSLRAVATIWALRGAGWQVGPRYWPESSGYTIRLPRGDRQWTLALQFIEEEAACCPAFAFEAAELDDAIVVRASFPGGLSA